MRYIDTHAHYNDKVYKDNLDEILAIIKDANVDKIINVGYSIEGSRECIELAKKYDYIFSTIGIHPESIEEDVDKLEELYNINKGEKIVAVGEIGLDYAYVKDNKEKQINLFKKQIKLAEKLKLPIIIHSRDAALDTYNIIKENVNIGTKLLFHCFAPTDDLVRLVLERKYFVAFGGNITYPRNISFKKYIEMIPIEQMVMETDSPYLSPIPFRGKINNSSNLNIICKKLAEYKNINEEELSKILYNNSIKLFDLK
ncbi:MAG: TatD family hydrolase [Clostridia bacterium]|nr:TatD family hydrolase [Clostridia bacterium]MDD4386182.1 TatD family hydrolase [Clostridia bacterium]